MNTRTIVVVLSLGFLLLMGGPDLRRGLGHPLGLNGFYVNANDTVVDASRNATASGIRVGDTVDLAHASFSQRVANVAIGTADPGQPFEVPLVRGNRHFVATVITTAEGQDTITMAMVREAIALLSAILGTLVLLRRPSVATWGFFFLMLIGCGPINDVYMMGPEWWRAAAYNLNDISVSVPPWGAIFFALYLLHPDPLPRWRRFAQGAAVLGAATAFALAVWSANAAVLGHSPNPAVAWAYFTMGALPLLLAPVVLLATYFESAPELRERLRWIIAGFSIALACTVIDRLGTQGNLGVIQMSYDVHSLLDCAINLSIGLPVAYAVLKHHIIDVNVAISRATVYTILSVGVVGAFALVDLFFAHALAAKSAGLIADVGLALALGFSFNTLHRHVDSFVDRILFRKRHLAEGHIAGLAVAMRYAQSESQVCVMLVDEPKRTFGISGARLFEHVRSGSDDMQTLASYLEGARAAVRVADGQWNLANVLDDGWVPSVAVPIFSHNALDAVLVYGMHGNGTDLDAQEITLLERLCDAAGAAFDRLEADRLRRENARLRSEMPALQI